MLLSLSNIVRSAGDPKIINAGPTMRTPAERRANALGWFSIALGTVELLAARRVTRALDMRGSEMLVRTFGLREIMSGIMSLSVEKRAGLWSRVAGDGLDIMALVSVLRSDSRRKGNASLALLSVVGIAMLDYMAAQELASETDQRKRLGSRRSYKDRSGFPKGIEAAKKMPRVISRDAVVAAS